MTAISHALALHVIASGSRGNAAVVENTTTGHGILIDCGTSGKALIEGCAACGFDAAKIDAVLVTHEHTDHVKGLGVATRKLAKLGCAPTLYTSEKVRAASSEVQQLADGLALETFASGDDLTLCGIDVHAFPTSHDAAESFGFRFNLSGDSIGFMTDTGVVTGEAREALGGCRILGLEANHDRAMLAHGPYPAYLKSRIASERGHLSNEQSADLLESLLSDDLEQVIGLHVSQNNNTYELPQQTLAQVLARAGHPAQVLVGFQKRPVSLR